MNMTHARLFLFRLGISLMLGFLMTLGGLAPASAMSSRVSSPPVNLLASHETSLLTPPVQMETDECGDSNGDGECDTNGSDD